ncbi:MAG: carbon-nitrogen hydrolase family protein [Bryobacteraceae bacterium]
MLALVALAAAAVAEDRVRIGLFSAVPVKWEVDANWSTFERVFLAHAAEKPDLVITPEAFLDGYAVADNQNWSRERFEKVAQDYSTSPYLARVRALAEKHRIAILFGYSEKRDGKFYNAALLVDREGRAVGQYYKTHLQAHDLRYAPGDDLPVFDTQWGKMGVLICADRRWPEAARTVRLKGARVTLVPSYGMWHEANEAWMRTRAYENENFLAFAHPNVAFVVDPKGAIVSKLQSNLPGMLVTDLDLAQVTDHRHLRDRRPDLYREIVTPRD